MRREIVLLGIVSLLGSSYAHAKRELFISPISRTIYMPYFDAYKRRVHGAAGSSHETYWTVSPAAQLDVSSNGARDQEFAAGKMQYYVPAGVSTKVGSGYRLEIDITNISSVDQEGYVSLEAGSYGVAPNNAEMFYDTYFWACGNNQSTSDPLLNGIPVRAGANQPGTEQNPAVPNYGKLTLANNGQPLRAKFKVPRIDANGQASTETVKVGMFFHTGTGPFHIGSSPANRTVGTTTYGDFVNACKARMAELFPGSREAVLGCEGPTTYATFNVKLVLASDRGAVLASARFVRDTPWNGGVVGNCTSMSIDTASGWRSFDLSGMPDFPTQFLNGGRPF